MNKKNFNSKAYSNSNGYANINNANDSTFAKLYPTVYYTVNELTFTQKDFSMGGKGNENVKYVCMG